jgi:hypothetical protein
LIGHKENIVGYAGKLMSEAAANSLETQFKAGKLDMN